MVQNYYPPVGFHFSVSFKKGSSSASESQFQSVSGLSVDIDTEEYAEGGENRFKHKLPVKTRYPNLVLKRGLFIQSDLIDWCKDAIENFKFERRDVTVILLNEQHTPLMTWEISGSFPVKWNVDDFNATESKLVIETIELSYNYFKVTSNF